MCYLAEKLTSYVINNSRYDEAEYNILKYGFQVGIELIICMSVNMLFAIHFHMMEEFVILIFVLGSVRSYCGGFHFKRYRSCFLGTSIFICGILLSVKWFDFSMIVMWIMIIQSSSYILKRKPVENPNKRLDINEKQYYGQKLKKNIFILYCVSLALFSMQKKTDIAIIGLTLTFIAISMIVGERLMDKK